MEQFAVKPVITFGTGALAALEELPGERVLVITDGFLAKSGLLDKVLAHLKGRTVEIFDQVVPDPPIDLVAKGARALADFKPRTVVAFGGGSPMDCAKAMLLFGKKLGALGEITFAAVPTTAGPRGGVTAKARRTPPGRGVIRKRGRRPPSGAPAPRRRTFPPPAGRLLVSRQPLRNCASIHSLPPRAASKERFPAMAMNYRKQKKQPEAPPQPAVPKVLHSPGGIKGRWMMNSLSFVLVILAAVVILISVGISGYYYATVRDNLVSRATTVADTFQKYFTETYDQFYTQAESTIATFQEQDKLEQQFLDTGGRVLMSTSGLTGGGMASTEDASQALSTQQTAVFTGRDPLSDERVMSVTAPLLSSRGDLIGGVRLITSLRIVERQIWIIIGISILACLLFLMLVVISNSYFVRSIVDPVLKINNIAKEIAAGRYGVRLQKTYDDEIGELCDTINYMSDEISRAERMKNDFISSVSHELRTPLTAIGGWSETLLAGGGEDPEEVMQGLTIIQKESNRLTRMVEELLDFARIESGRMKLEVELFDLSIELYEAVYMYENLLQKSGIQLSYDEDVEANYYINGDRHRMKQVFLNILDNAAKYGADGKKIDITLRRDGGKIVASVRDYGQGIPEAELPFVKEKFYKGSSKQRGSGIGLAVTDEIVTLHGGTLDIASTLGAGTTVTVTLPAAEAEEALGITGAIPKIPDTPFNPEGEA